MVSGGHSATDQRTERTSSSRLDPRESPPIGIGNCWPLQLIAGQLVVVVVAINKPS